jgi:hypothetical protein
METNFNTRFLQRLDAEKCLLNGKPTSELKMFLYTQVLLANVSESAKQTRDKVLTVLRAINALGEDWSHETVSSELLPAWFVSACAIERSQAQAEEWLRMWRTADSTEKNRLEKERGWELSNWVYCLEPNNRFWFLVNEKIIAANQVEFTIALVDWPVPIDSFLWLIQTAGVISYEIKEN